MNPAFLTSAASISGVKRVRAALALTVAVLALAPSAWAASGTWLDTGTTSANWNTASNWVGGTIPGSTIAITGTNANADTATFSSTVGTYGSSATPIIIDSASENIKSITFSTSSVGNYFIGATTGSNNLYLTSGGSISISSGSTTTAVETINAPLVIEGTNGTYSFTNSDANAGDSLVLNGAISGGAAGNTVITFGGSGTPTMNYANGIIGNGSATTMGLSQSAGNWTYAGANTYTGATYIYGGTAYFTTANTTTSSVTVGFNSSLFGVPGTSGTLDLGGANGALGANTINVGNGGTLTYDNTAASNSSRLAPSQIINLNGGTFAYKGITAGTSATSTGSVYELNLGAYQTSGLSTTAASSGAGNTSTLTIGSINLGTDSTLTTSLATANGTSGRVVLTTAPTTMANGIIPWAVETTNGAFLTIVTGTNYIGGYGNISGSYQTGASSTWATTDNVKLSSGTTTASASNLTINSLTMATSAGATILDLGSPSNTFVIGSGGVLTTGNNASTIQDGTLTASNAAGSYNLYLWNTGTGTQTISANIADNSTNPVTVIKAGSNTTVLSGTNTYTGPTIVDGGTLTISGSTSASSAFTVGQGGTLTNSGTIGGSVTVNDVVANATNGGLTSASTTLTPDFTNSGTVNGTLTINGAGPQSPNANSGLGAGYVAGVAQINPGSTNGAITNNGILQFEGTTGAAPTIGTISGSSAYGAFIDNDTSSSGISLTLASGSSFSYFRPTNTSGTTYATFAVAGGGTNATSFAYLGYNSQLGGVLNLTLNGGTFNIGYQGQNNSGTGFNGTETLTNGSTVNLTNNGNYLHGTFNVINGTFNSASGFSENHNDVIIPLQLTVNNTGGGSGSLVNITGTTSLGLVGLTSGQATSPVNSVTVGSGGTFTTSGQLDASDSSAFASAAAAETNEFLVQGGTLNANGSVYLGSNLTNTSAYENNLLTVSSGTANVTNGTDNVTVGVGATTTNTVVGSTINNTLTLSGGKLLISGTLAANAPSGTASITLTTTNGSTSATASTATGLAVGQTLTSANLPANETITAISGTTITLSTGTGVTAGSNIATTATGTGTVNNGFYWTGGELAAGTITPSANWNATSGTPSLTSAGLINNGASGTTLAPGDIGTAGKTTINGAYTQGSNGTLAIDLGGTTQATSFQNTSGYYDYLAVTGNASLGGNLTLNIINGLAPTTGNVFTFVKSSGTLSGTFNTGGTTQFQTGTGAYANGFYVLSNSTGLNGLLLGYTSTTGTLTYTASSNTYAGAASSAWDATGAASWTQFDPGSASGGLGSLAQFGNDTNALSGPIAVSLSSVRDVQGINFNSTVAGNNYTITGSGSGAIIFDNTGNSTSAAITDTSATGNSNTIAAPITLNSSLNAAVNAGNTLTLSGNISGTNNGVVATNSGTVVLTGNNTYTGPTYAEGGTLLVNNTAGSGTGSGSIGVSGGATLGGTGTITPGTGNTVAIYGNLSSGIAGTAGSGNAVGTGLTINSTNLQAAGAVNFEGVSSLSFNLGSGNTASTLNLTNTGSFAGEVAGLSGDTFNFTDLTAGHTLSTGLYTLIATDSTSSALFAGLTAGNLTENITGLSYYQTAGDQVNVQLNQVGGVYDIQLDIAAVPEPSTWAMMLVGGLALLVYFQRRKSVPLV